MSARSPRFRPRLLVLGLPVAIPAILALLYLQSGERRDAFAAEMAAPERTARVVASREADLFVSANRLLNTLAQFPQVRSSDGTCRPILAKILASNPDLVNLSVLNRDGSLICSAVPVDPARYFETTRHPWFTRLLSTGRPVIGEPQISMTTGRLKVVVARPILDASGAVTRILVAGLDLEAVSRMFAESGLPRGESLTLVSGAGTVVARFPRLPEEIGKPLPEARGVRDSSKSRYRFLEVKTDGEFDQGYRVALELDPSTALFAADRVRFQFLMLMLGIALIGGLSTLVMAHWWVVRPARELKAVAADVAAGRAVPGSHLDARLFGLDELGDAFHAMATAVASREHERDLALSELRTSEMRYRMLFDENPNPMCVYDVETLRFLEVNASGLDTYGYPRDEFLTMGVPDVRVSASGDGATPALQSRIMRHRRADGRVIDVAVSARPIEFAGRPAMLATSIDISDRMKAERAMRESEERTRFALEASNVGVWEVNLRSGVATWSEVAERMHGLSKGTFGGSFRAFIDAVHPDDRESAERELERGMHTRSNADLEYRTVMPDGSVRHVRSIGQFFYGHDGSPARGAGVVMDVTEQRSIEGQLRQAQKMEAVGQLAGGVAHDFNNLLTVIGGNADFALGGLPAESPARADLEQVVTAVDRAARLTRQLLAFGRKQVLRRDAVDVDGLIGNLLPMLHRLIEENIELTHAPLSRRPTTVGDGGQLEQAIINLVVNARDAMPAGGSIRITTAARDLTDADVTRHELEIPAGAYVVVSVTDTGTGMTPDVLARAFDPFFTTKALGRGTGLGLSSVYGTVKQSGGQLIAESRVGAGTTVTMFLPKVDAAGATACPAPAGPTALGPSLTVLLIEDDDGVRRVAEHILSAAGCRVLAASRPDFALDQARAFTGSIDVILSDIVMPGPPIADIVERIRRDRPSIGVVFMSGYPDRDVQHRVRVSAVDLLPKPFTRDALLSAIHRASERQHVETAA